MPATAELAPVVSPSLTESLELFYGYREFRPLQEDAVQAALDGRDLLVVMPTGAGKSLCFQLPAALQTGLTLVVSPLIALMRDQVDALNRRPEFRELGCACLNSLQGMDEQRQIRERIRSGRIRLLYVAPERFRSPAFLEDLARAQIVRFVVDEAHCISEWGHDFRPDYLTLKEVLATLGRPPVTALTATATRRVQDSIVNNLGMHDPVKEIGGFNRPNLHYAVRKCKNEADREDLLARALPKLAARGGSGLIYVATRKQCDSFAEIADHALKTIGLRAGAYHGGMEAEERNAMQSAWLAGDLHTLVATNAFGMGIDKPDVRFVIHCAVPDSIENYYQEAGRAGRDGAKSRCVILYHFSDRRTREWFIDNEGLTIQDVQTAHRHVLGWSEGETAVLPRLWYVQIRGENRWSEVKARLALGELEKSGLTQRVSETTDELTLRLTRRDFPAEALGRIRADLDQQRRERLRRLDEMMDYCKTYACRRRTVLDYFGDRKEPLPSPFCCDNCDHPPDAPTPTTARLPAVPMPAQVNPGDIYSILNGLDALRPALGKTRLSKLLRGSETRGNEGPMFGLLRGCTVRQADYFIQRLIEAKLLHQGEEDEYFVCTVTALGRQTWQERLPTDVAAPRAPGEWSADESDGAGPIFDALRQWRAGIASQEALPPYCIFGDKTLREIARRRPATEDDLRGVTGVGPAKLARFGPAVLEIMARMA